MARCNHCCVQLDFHPEWVCEEEKINIRVNREGPKPLRVGDPGRSPRPGGRRQRRQGRSAFQQRQGLPATERGRICLNLHTPARLLVEAPQFPAAETLGRRVGGLKGRWHLQSISCGCLPSAAPRPWGQQVCRTQCAREPLHAHNGAPL